MGHNIMWLKTPTGRRRSTSVAKELNLGLLRTNPASGVRAGLKPRVSEITSPAL